MKVSLRADQSYIIRQVEGKVIVTVPTSHTDWMSMIRWESLPNSELLLGILQITLDPDWHRGPATDTRLRQEGREGGDVPGDTWIPEAAGVADSPCGKPLKSCPQLFGPFTRKQQWRGVVFYEREEACNMRLIWGVVDRVRFASLVHYRE